MKTLRERLGYKKTSSKPYKVSYICKADGHEGQSYRCDTFEEAEVAKASMEKVWGASEWNVVITKD